MMKAIPHKEVTIRVYNIRINTPIYNRSNINIGIISTSITVAGVVLTQPLIHSISKMVSNVRVHSKYGNRPYSGQLSKPSYQPF